MVIVLFWNFVLCTTYVFHVLELVVDACYYWKGLLVYDNWKDMLVDYHTWSDDGVVVKCCFFVEEKKIVTYQKKKKKNVAKRIIISVLSRCTDVKTLIFTWIAPHPFPLIQLFVLKLHFLMQWYLLCFLVI